MAVGHGGGSGRPSLLAQLCGGHDAYRWLCGGGAHQLPHAVGLSSGHQGALDDLLTQIVASPMAAGAVTLERWPKTECVCGPAPGQFLDS